MSYDQDFEPTRPSVEPAPRRLALPLSPIRATYALIAINAGVFLVTFLSLARANSFGALIPGLVLSRQEWWRLLTSGFLHADFLHIGFNLYALYMLGALAERFFGTGRFLGVYFVALLGSGVLVTILSPLDSPTIGASGAIMGVLGALVVYYWRYRDSLIGGRNYLGQLIRLAIINIGIGLLPGISLWGHLGGFLAGAMMGWVVLPRYKYTDSLEPALEITQLGSGALLGSVVVLAVWLVLLALGIRWRG